MNRLPIAYFLGPCLLGLGLLLSGCAQFYALRGNVGQQVDQWVAQKEYGRAIDTLEHVSPSRSDYHRLQAKLRKVRREADAYIRSVIAKAEKLEDKHQWVQAGHLLDTALDRLPDAPKLQKAQQRFSKRRADYVRTLKWQALIRRGEWLAADAPLRRQIANAEPDSWSASRHLHKSVQEGQETGSHLNDAGQQAMHAGNLDLAERALILAEQLNPSPQVKAALAKVRRLQTKERASAHAAATRQRRARIASQVRQQSAIYQRCYRHRDWACARRALTKIRDIDPHNPTLAKQQRQLDTHLRKQLAKGMEKGRRLYSLGKIQAALDTWLSLRPLDPNNSELEAHIARARRVLAKLKQLREHPATVVPP